MARRVHAKRSRRLVGERPAALLAAATTEPPFGRYEMETLADDVIFVYGVGHCLGDMDVVVAREDSQ